MGLVVVTQKNLVRGIITDGDARRGMKYNSKEDNIAKFMSSNPLFVSENMPASKALSLMNEKKITSLLVFSDKIRGKNKKLRGIVHIHALLKYGIK